MKHLQIIFFSSIYFFANAQEITFEKYKIIYDQYLSVNNYDSALITARKLNEWALDNQGDSSFYYAVSLRYIGNCFNSTDSSEKYYLKSLSLFNNKDWDENDFASLHNNLGNIRVKKNLFKEALFHYKMALEIRRKNKEKYPGEYSSSLSNMGNYFVYTGNYPEAEPFFLESLTLRKNLFGENNNLYAESLANLATFYLTCSDFKNTENLYQEALRIKINIFGDDHYESLKVKNNLATYYKIIGDFESAKNLYLNSLTILSKKPENYKSEIANLHNSLGVLFKDQKNYESARYHLEQSRVLNLEFWGDKHSSYATIVNNLGNLYLDLNNPAMADSLFKIALQIREKTFGKEHSDYLITLRSLAKSEIRKKNLEKALRLYEYILAVRLKNQGEKHPDYMNISVEYSFLLNSMGQHQRAFELLKTNFENISSSIRDNFEWFSEIQKELFWKKEYSFYDQLSFFSDQNFDKIPESASLNFDVALFSKSKLLEAKISSENFYREQDEIREDLADKRKYLIKLESEGSADMQRLTKLRKETDSLDKKLSLSWPEYANQKKNLSLDWKKVKANLESSEVAIEFVRFHNPNDSAFYYNALLLSKEEELPKLIRLCREDSLSIALSDMSYDELYKLVWLPMEKSLSDVKTVYYSPVALLNNIPFAALRATTEKKFLADKFTLHQLTSTRYLALGLKKKASEILNKSIALFGAVNYNFLPGTENSKPKKDKSGKRSSTAAYSALTFLEGTKTEVESINRFLNDNWQKNIYIFNDAREEEFMKLETKNSRSILHLATHGYAFPEFDFKDSSISKNSLRYSFRFSKNPMVRSGLILAGGNWAWTGSDTLSKLGLEQNGILTALEVSQLNLRKTKLVVLSACETGLGKIEGSEGTFGLKRGFKLAGVEQIIVSLWSVPDKETMELMTLFYNDLSITLNPVISFEKAQKEMRKKYPTEPEKWAGFVLVR